MRFVIETSFYFVIVAGVFSLVYSTLRLGISPMPSSLSARREVLKMLPRDVQGKIYELGSGWGGFAAMVARACPLAQVHGYELSFIPWLWSKAWTWRVKNLTLHRKDFFQEDLRDAEGMICYLFTGGMKRLEEKEIAKDAWIISCAFAFPSRKPKKVAHAEDLHATKIYFYN